MQGERNPALTTLFLCELYTSLWHMLRPRQKVRKGEIKSCTTLGFAHMSAIDWIFSPCGYSGGGRSIRSVKKWPTERATYKEESFDYYQPHQHISMNEWMVKSKARCQYMRNKPTKLGLKLWVLADMIGCTVNINEYTGRLQGVLKLDKHMMLWSWLIPYLLSKDISSTPILLQ